MFKCIDYVLVLLWILSHEIHYITPPANDDCGKLTTGVAGKSCLARKAFVAQDSVLR